MEKDIQDARAYASTAFARDVLSVSDNLARAIDAIQNTYRVIRAADAHAALSVAEHAATLHIRGMVFADLRSVEELEAILAVEKAEAA
jgi:hypothetical protein